ncbi:glutaredoxin family protein [Methylophaga pinxianii]|uniref:glutaredoxin family protein n=1 Tax=Methylophaga pinxianii TaxID=2881052 RepID=UPI001CF237EB|nr:glutaredoxin family protein [Methylophaga pinxianii]MCB2426613.1 glutaredoxin family protein [Methylophaga pinxianii]UPH45490.1 glutaredoxin family protein [Methylophaga pinxianii]
MIELQLFSTAGCHLCDLAVEQIKTLPLAAQITVDVVEIGDDEMLVEQYGVRIPVIKFPDQSELNWPFNQNDILHKIASNYVEL